MNDFDENGYIDCPDCKGCGFLYDDDLDVLKDDDLCPYYDELPDYMRSLTYVNDIEFSIVMKTTLSPDGVYMVDLPWAHFRMPVKQEEFKLLSKTGSDMLPHVCFKCMGSFLGGNY